MVHAYIPRSCHSHKICIFMFPRISGEKNNSSNGAVPDPSFFVKGLARETSQNHGEGEAMIMAAWFSDINIIERAEPINNIIYHSEFY